MSTETVAKPKMHSTFSLFTIFLLFFGTFTSISLESDAYSTWTEAEKEANKLIKQMTLEEKVNMTTGIAQPYCTGMTGSVPRLGIPSFCLSDGPTGIAGVYNVSQFPSPITLAATWNTDLAIEQGLSLGQEFHDVGVNYAFAPVAGGPLGRSPFGGRFWESLGPDEYLTGKFGSQLVKGLQTGVVACTKHFIGYEQEEQRSENSILPQLRKPYSVNMDDFTMHQLYLWPFAETARAGTGQVMCSFNSLNGTQACQNSDTLNGLLKHELNFRGNVVSDYGAVYSNEDSANNGLDMLMPGDGLFGVLPNYFGSKGTRLQQAVKSGKVKESRVDDMVKRILTPILRFQYDSKFTNFIPPKIHNAYVAVDPIVSNDLGKDVQRDHYKIIRKVGTEAITLVKNTKNALPLNKETLNQNKVKIAILGSDAFGSTDGGKSCSSWNDCDDTLQNQGTQTDGIGSGAANPPYIINPLEAIQSYLKDANQITIQSSRAEPHKLGGKDSVSHAIDLANGSDIAIVFGNARSKEKEDRTNLTLRQDVDDLIKKVAEVNQQTIVVLHSALPLILEQWIDLPNVVAVLFAYYPGQESGASLTPILFGEESPSGKLPFVIVKNKNDYPPNAEDDQPLKLHPQIDFKEGILIDWKWLDAKGIQPRFPFGFGLSYTNFHYDSMSVKQIFIADSENEFSTNEAFEQNSKFQGNSLYDEILQVSLSVHNSGKVKAAEVIQLYVSFPTQSGMYAPHLLRGFVKKEIEPGQNVQITFSIRRKDISVWDTVQQKWKIPLGQFTFFAGPQGAADWNNKAQATFIV